MPERLECEVLQKACYINTLTFTFILHATYSPLVGVIICECYYDTRLHNTSLSNLGLPLNLAHGHGLSSTFHVIFSRLSGDDCYKTGQMSVRAVPTFTKR